MKITFIGGGNMAAAMIGGVIARGFPANDICAVDVSATAREKLASQFGINVYLEFDKAARQSDILVLAVKPQQMAEVAKGLKPFVAKQLILTIAAGIRSVDLSRWLGNYRNIVRAMPNTPALVRAGVSGVYAMAEVDENGRSAAQRLLEAIGQIVWLEDESQLDAVTALSGSGPAYVFYFLEALQAAGETMGLSAEVSRILSLQTLSGAAKLAAESHELPEVLRARVTSKGGTTERALREMEANSIKQHLIIAIEAARLRSRELGDEFGTSSSS